MPALRAAASARCWSSSEVDVNASLAGLKLRRHAYAITLKAGVRFVRLLLVARRCVQRPEYRSELVSRSAPENGAPLEVTKQAVDRVNDSPDAERGCSILGQLTEASHLRLSYRWE